MKTTYSVFSYNFLKSFIIHCRPYLMFVSGVAGLAGIALADIPNFNSSIFWISFIPLFLGYGFGQALTDTWQTDTDTISAPYRPLSKGLISKRSVRIVSLTGLVFCSGLIIYLNPWNIIFGCLSIIGLATYSYFKKNYWFIGPIYNAWIVALLPIMGYLSISGSELEVLLNLKLILVCSLSFIAYSSFVLIGYLKDITADRVTGYRTFPVVFGWTKTVWVGDIIVLISLVIISILVETKIGIIMAVIATAMAISGQIFAHLVKVKIESNATFPIVMSVRSFILWHFAVILDNHLDWIYPMILFYLVFELFLYFRPEKSQI